MTTAKAALENLYEQLEKLRQVGEEGVIDVTENIKELEKKIQTTKNYTIY